MYTRYLVSLDDATDLTVVEQNLTTRSMHVLEARGRAVRLVWPPDQMHRLGEAPQTEPIATV
jgi:hypothetical protein